VVCSLVAHLGPQADEYAAQRLAKWFTTLSPKEKAKIVKDVSQLVLSRRTRMCNFLEYKGVNPRNPFLLPQLVCLFKLTVFSRHEDRLPPLCVPLLYCRVLIH
jgi:clathrin adaptor complex small subunit